MQQVRGVSKATVSMTGGVTWNNLNMFMVWEIVGALMCAGLVPAFFKGKLPRKVIVCWTLLIIWQVFHGMTLPFRDTSSYTKPELTNVIVYSNLQCLFMMTL